MSGSLIGGVVGATIGFFVGGPAGAMQGFAIGSAVGGVIMPGELPPVLGPRLNDLRAQSSEYGRPIPIAYGTVGMAGNVIESEDIREVSTTTEQGGKGGPSQEVTEYSYYLSFAVVVCEGEADVLRIWSGPEKRLIYDGFLLEGGTIRIYRGTEDQLPDPLLEQIHGVGNVPAYRGYCYVVFEDYPLANDLNRTPFLTFEVSTGSSSCGVNYETIGTARLYDPAPEYVSTHAGTTVRRGAAQDPYDGMLYYVRESGGVSYLDKVDPSAGFVDSVEIMPTNGTYPIMALNPDTRTVAVINWASTDRAFVDLASFSVSVGVSDYAKADVLCVNGAFVYLNYSNHGTADDWGRTGVVAGGYLIDCDGQVAAISNSQNATFGGAALAGTIGYQFEVYDPNTNRLIALNDSAYYDFASGSMVELATPFGYTVINVTYNPYVKRIFATSGTTGMLMFDPTTFNQEDGFPVECVLFHNGEMLYADESTVNKSFSIMPVVLPNDPRRMAFIDAVSGDSEGDIFLFTIGAEGQGMVLSEIVSDLCQRAGVTSYDVSELTDMVDGYAIAKQTDVRAAIDALRSAYYFDAVESAGVVKFVKRGGTTITEIADEDLCAHAPGAEPGDPLKTVRLQEIELPRSVTVNYLQAATDYSAATKTAKRLTGYSEDQTTLEMPLVLSDTKAQEVAEVNLHAAWAQRLQYEFSTSRKYAHLEPTDLVRVKGYVMRIVKVSSSPFGIIKYQAYSDESVYSPHVVVTETPPNGGTVYVPGETILSIM